ncbi:MAG: hypothetical protein RR415_13390 [Ruthenibacterium sp.]
MSTRSTISILTTKGHYRTVYCHSNGYPSYLGKMLLEHYNAPKLAKQLVALGDLSIVRERLAPNEGEVHSFDKPVRKGPNGGITLAYHRDRDEPLNIGFCRTEVELKEASGDCCADYMYVYDMEKGCWFVAPYASPAAKFVQLTEKIIKENT